MKCIDLSNYIKNNFPATKSSRSKRRLISGIGVNDSDYVVNPSTSKGRMPCPAYSTWRDMISRCSNDEYKIKHPAYAEASVCDEWIYFTKFREWWESNAVDGWEIDKDLLKPFNKVYSPETCIYVPQWLNVLVIDSSRKRIGSKIGSCFDKSRGKYICICSVGYGNTKNLGRFDTEEEAHEAWLSERIRYILSRSDEINSINESILENLITITKSKV